VPLCRAGKQRQWHLLAHLMRFTAAATNSRPAPKIHSRSIPAHPSVRRFVDAKTRTWINFLRTYLPAVIARDEALLAHVARGTPLQVNGTFPLVS
jgi:hypothetical protein